MTGFFYKRGKAAYSRYLVLPFFYAFFMLFFLLVLSPGKIPAQSPLPLIPRLDSRDMVFSQFQNDVEDARRHLFSPRRNMEETASFLTIYNYLTREEDDLLRIAARSNIPYAALASLNRISNIENLSRGMLLLLPSMPGIFVPENPGSELENLISSARAETGPGILLNIPRENGTERFMFFPGDDFNSTERIFFLNQGFRFPLRDFRISSLFGPRINPVTGRSSNHQGIDLAAPMGAEVFAVRNGTVIDMGNDQILGNYIIVEHEGNWVSLYGHLSVINTSLNTRVQSGSLIGRVGSSGQSTGPHLHFELIHNGQNHDPARLLRLFRGIQGQ